MIIKALEEENSSKFVMEMLRDMRMEGVSLELEILSTGLSQRIWVPWSKTLNGTFYYLVFSNILISCIKNLVT